MAFHSYNNGQQYFNGSFFWGLTTMLLMNRAYSGAFMDISPLTTRPLRGFAFFLMGASINVFVNVASLGEQGYLKGEYNLERRVAENEHTHAVLKTLGHQLDKRGMSVFDANPR